MDEKDGARIADLPRHGFIAKSFAPPKPVRELRALARYHHALPIEGFGFQHRRASRFLDFVHPRIDNPADAAGRCHRGAV